ncbi:MAG: DNA repair ATPase [Pirellulales bacterium]|nr:DNA repair ATPase [Pirellulales bacterium]
MAQPDQAEPKPDEAQTTQLESGTYEILQNRLRGHGKELERRLDQLNEARKEVFGAIETTLLATDRITTEHNCEPRDMIAVGDQFLLGFNVHFGLKNETDLEDVFAVYEFKNREFQAQSLQLIDHPQFRRDFAEVYRYYKSAVFVKFFVSGPHLYMVFRVGADVRDIKSFKWLMRDGALTYIDNRSDHEVRYPPQHEFEWVRTHRDLHQGGVHPHVSIEDRIFVETVGGDLTIKIENNTDVGEGIYDEPVDNPDQTLDDALIYYASIGNIILLKIRPYQEEQFRYIVYNEKIQEARRIDAIEHACVLLPDEHGLIFSNGYYLQNGEHKTFDHNLSDMLFERRIAAPNGEDYLYVFYNRRSGVYVLLRYNVIEQRVDTPLICNGLSLFEAGEAVVFRSGEKPEKHHTLQIWQTPYVSQDYVPQTDTDSLLFKIGNRDMVRGMAECHEVLGLIDKEDTYAGLYVDLAKKAGDILDAYFWIDHEETFKLSEPLTEIRAAADAAIDEFEKVVRVKQTTAGRTKEVEGRTNQILGDVQHRRFESIDEFVSSLGDLRTVRGSIISLRELRYVDLGLLESLETQVVEQSDRLAKRCVDFLLGDAALAPYEQRVTKQNQSVDSLEKVADARRLLEDVDASARELEMLIEIVGNLKIDDATQRTAIIDNISAIFAKVNTARAAIKTKIQELLSVEGVAEFGSQIKLLDQSVVSYLDLCDSPDKCEELLTKVMVQIEELEGRFAEFDEFVVQLSEKRDEIYNAFESRKLAIIEKRNKRASSLMSAADRILKGIKHRVEGFDSIDAINSYFASDLMIEKVRDLVEQLKELDDTVKVDDIQSRLKTVREDAVRQLKDRQELFVGGDNVIKLGNHQFNVNVQSLDLTTVLRDDQIMLHLTGTNFFEPLEDDQLLGARDVWQQEVISENTEVYRAEYLAYVMQHALGSDSEARDAFLKAEPDARVKQVQQFMGPRYAEAYVKGVTDNDAAKILFDLLQMTDGIGLLRYHTQARALGRVYWEHFAQKPDRTLYEAKLGGFGLISELFPANKKQETYVAELKKQLTDFVADSRIFDESLTAEAAEYLFAELARGNPFCISRTAAELVEDFQRFLQQSHFETKFADSVESLSQNAASRFMLLRDWVDAYLETDADRAEYRDEVAAVLMHGDVDGQLIVDGQVTATLSDMVGSHPVIDHGSYHLHYNRFSRKLTRFDSEVVPRFQSYHDRKAALVDEARDEMRLEEFRPRVLTSFVRNKLIDTVYLPLIGDNLAKQIGTAGEQKRTDRMGLLLLVSPPGYGKTTLMEYLANRLGIIFMKINGPAIGHQVTSLDPAEAPNAAAREEVEKLNLSLEMGDNVMLYLDDIQHCNPEFLQKFISLCDATRKIEGVYKGKTRTYDLRGRKVVVVMAGNPYTESGERFQIPDMLSNRADVYNLGEIIGDTAEAFEMSYLENCLTSNPVLNKLASRSQKDVYAVIRMAETDNREGIEFEGNYSSEELAEFVATMKKLMRVRDVILAVNRQYIDSAAQSDDYRTEPAFKLQGSYRNMNRMAEKVVPIMNDDELQSLILSNYENDAQTLTSDTESNLLKLRELLGILTDEEARRWADIKRTFQENMKMRGIDSDDELGQVIAQLRSFNDGLYAIQQAMTAGVESLTQAGKQDEDEAAREQVTALVDRLTGLSSGLNEIRDALTGGMKQLADAAQTEPPSAPVPVPTAAPTEHMAQAVEAIMSLADELRDLTTGTVPIDPKRQTRVSVSHRVPSSILGVIESQFELMKDSIAPVLTATHQHSAEFQEMREALQASLDRSAEFLEELRSAKKVKKKRKQSSEDAPAE